MTGLGLLVPRYDPAGVVIEVCIVGLVGGNGLFGAPLTSGLETVASVFSNLSFGRDSSVSALRFIAELAPVVANTWPFRSDVGLEESFLLMACFTVLVTGVIGFVVSPPIELRTELRNYVDSLANRLATGERLHTTHTHGDNAVASHRLRLEGRGRFIIGLTAYGSRFITENMSGMCTNVESEK